MIEFLKKEFPYPHWEYLNKETNDRLTIAPERGGLITGWRCKDKEVLYFDQERFLIKTQSVRGGIPLLFPICGDLPGGVLRLPKGQYPMNQHGFARDSCWKITLLEDNLGIRLEMSDSPTTLAIFPYKFMAQIEARLKLNRLEIKIKILNQDNILIPFSFGLHPYFNVSNLNQVDIQGIPPACVDQRNMQEDQTKKQIENLNQGVDFLSGPSSVVKIMDLSSGNKIKLEHEAPMDLTVVWTDPPRSMVCVEPWTSPRASLITGDRMLHVEPGCSYTLNTAIEYE